MRNLFTVLAIVFAVGILASCKKEYKCVCEFPDDTLPMFHSITARSSSDADDQCKDIEQTAYSHIGPNYNVNCHIE